MDTFFFIHVNVEAPVRTTVRLGPYATFVSAAEILVDCLPSVLSAETHHKQPIYYEASISEWMILDGKWERLATSVTENVRG